LKILTTDDVRNALTQTEAYRANEMAKQQSKIVAMKWNSDVFRTVALKSSKGFRLERRKPFVFFIELVAGVRFELTTFGL
jgi:hypothetical protein